MKRTLSCCLAAFALATASASLAGCKKSGEDTTKPDTAGGTDTGGGGGGDFGGGGGGEAFSAGTCRVVSCGKTTKVCVCRRY